MHYRMEIRDDILIVNILVKRATAEMSGHLKDDLIKKIEDGYSKVVINLERTDFVDSTFLGVLVAGLKKATINNGDLKICALQNTVRRIFELTRLYRIFDIFDNPDDAVGSF